MRRFVAGILVLFAGFFAVQGRAELDVLANIPKETKFLIRVDVASVLKSELGATVTMTNNVKLEEIKSFIRQHVGLDLDLVDRLWVMSWKEDTGVIIMNGHFDVGQLRAKFGMGDNVREVERRSCMFAAEFVDEKNGKEQLGAVVDDRTLVFGDRPSVNHFLDVMTKKTGKLPATNPKLAKFREKADHVVATMLADLGAQPDFDKDIAGAIKEVWLTAQLDGNINVIVTVVSSNASKAEGIEMLVKGLARLKGDSAGVRRNVLLHQLIQRAVLKREGNTVTATSTIQGTMIQQLTQTALK